MLMSTQAKKKHQTIFLRFGHQNQIFFGYQPLIARQ